MWPYLLLCLWNSQKSRYNFYFIFCDRLDWISWSTVISSVDHIRICLSPCTPSLHRIRRPAMAVVQFKRLPGECSCHLYELTFCFVCEILRNPRMIFFIFCDRLDWISWSTVISSVDHVRICMSPCTPSLHRIRRPAMAVVHVNAHVTTISCM
jgi:hypothetical protein